MKTPSRPILTVLAAGLLLGLAGLGAGCSLPPAQPDPTRYYVLSSAPAQPAAAATAARAGRVLLRPVELPVFLRGKPLPVRVAGNEITYADEARWAEPLEAGLGRVLRERLEGRGEGAWVVTTAGQEHDLEVAVRVQHCEGDRALGVARFTATVEIYAAGPGGARRCRETFTTEIPGWDGQGYGPLAAQLSAAVEAFGERLATLLAAANP